VHEVRQEPNFRFIHRSAWKEEFSEVGSSLLARWAHSPLWEGVLSEAEPLSALHLNRILTEH
jgi:hypothetical protein